jgi:nucleoside-diphosphate-sugar epimerase
MTARKYLVTGGAGFSGSHITEALLKRNRAVRVFDNLATGNQNNIQALQLNRCYDIAAQVAHPDPCAVTLYTVNLFSICPLVKEMGKIDSRTHCDLY